AATCAIALPVLVPPVNEIIFTSGCAMIALPTLRPAPGSTLTTPLGTPASRQMRPSSSATSGVGPAGFSSTALPAASAGASFCAPLRMGEFQGVIPATTPHGSQVLIVR